MFVHNFKITAKGATKNEPSQTLKAGFLVRSPELFSAHAQIYF